MTPIVYPSTLPFPNDAPIQSAERRLLSSIPGPRQSRALSRDRLATQEVSFLFSFDEAAVFNAWWKDDLNYGGAWFASDWPLPQGGIGVRRFLGPPKWGAFIPAVGWPVSAVCEVMGRGELPGLPETCDLVLSSPPGQTLRLQLLFDGDFSDSSGNFPDFAAHPSSTISTVIKRCGSGALHLPNYDSYAHLVSGGSPPNYGTDDGIPMPGDFTVRCLLYPESLGTISARATVWTARNASDPFTVNHVSFGIGSNGMYCRLNNAFIDVTGSFSTGEWCEVEWQRIGGTITMKKNRAVLGTGTSGYANNADSYGSVGSDPIQNNGFIGYVDSLSIWTE